MNQNTYKRIAIIIAFTGFKDEEYFIPREIFERERIDIMTVSNQGGLARGVSGAEVIVDVKMEDFKIDDYDGVVFVGGPGCLKNLDNELSYKIIQETVEQNKVLAAICISPVILSRAGVLREKKATVWSDTLDKSPIKILEENGAIYQDKNVVIDGKIITANGPQAAEDFAEAVIKKLSL